MVEIQYPNKSIIISNVYHSPNPPSNCTVQAHSMHFLELLDAHLSDLSDSNKESFVFLDSNIDLLKVNESTIANDYMDVNISNGFLQLISRATRIQGNHVSLIDHILSNSRNDTYTSGTIVHDLSDHFINYMQLPNSKQKTKIKPTFRRNFSSNNVQNFKTSLSGSNWQPIYDSNDVDVSFDLFWKIFNELYELNFPLKKFKFNKNIHKINDYLTSGLLISRKNKMELCKKAAKERTIEALNTYKNYRNIYNNLVRLSKKMYFDSNFTKFKKNPKKTWELLKEAANLNSSNDSVERLRVNNEDVTDPGLMAEHFNDFFVKIGKEISDSISETDVKPESFMPDLPDLNELELNEIHSTLIRDIIKSFTSKGSLDSDGLSTKLLKNISNEICGPLAHIFNLSVQQGIFPNKLKRSRTVPIFKSGDPTTCDNYRPISLLSTLSKILEKIISVQLVNHLDRNDLLYKHQYGFQRGKSTEHNLVQAFNFIGNAINDNKYCIGVFFDLKKAFDVCSKDILLMKMEKMGIKGIALKWFKSYLSNRTQFVDIGGNFSSEKDITTCILQGSILGPILFLIYINDLFHVSTALTLMFADDTFGLKSDSDINRLIMNINQDINKMAIWFKSNKLAVNKSKTKYIIFRARGKKVPENLPPVVIDENEQNKPYDHDKVTEIERYHNNHADNNCKAYKLLGIYLDEYLSLDFHVNHIVKKLNRSLYCIRMAKNNLKFEGLRALYFAIIHSHLSYCPVILNCLSATNKNRLSKVQKKAIRVITNSNYNAHTAPLFVENKILPFEKLLKQGLLNFMHSIHFNYAPKSFEDVWNQNVDRNLNVTLRNDENYRVPIPRTEFFKKMPLYTLPNAWNSAGNLILLENKTTFKIAVKNELFEELLLDLEL